MSLPTTLYAVADALDPRMAYWSVTMRSGKVRSERTLIPTWHKGISGLRKLDWLWDIVGTGDIKHVKELRIHCPNGQAGVIERGPERYPIFQFRQKSLHILGGCQGRLEFLCVGRVIDTGNGWCEAFIWDYFPKLGEPNLVAWQTNINDFGAWRDTMTPIGALSMEVQGFRL